jgi:hypothetical protein
MGADPAKLGIVFTQAPRETSVREAFSQLASHLMNGHFPNVSFDAALHESTAFERARELQIPIPSVLNGLVNFETTLQQARQAGAPELTLHALAHKLLAQRALLGYREAIAQAIDALRLPRISPEDWLQEMSGVPGSQQQEAIAAECGIMPGTPVVTDSSPLPQ